MATSRTPPAARLPSRLLRDARVVPSHDHLLAALVPARSFVEVGVALGDRTRVVLDHAHPSRMVAIDRFELDRQETLWGIPVAAALQGRSHRAYFEAQFCAELENGLLSIITANPENGLAQLDEHSVDTILLDDGQSYDEIYCQLRLGATRVRRDGVLIVNNYSYCDVGPAQRDYGVTHAVNDFMIRNAWEMVCLSLHPKMFLTVAIRRTD